MRSVDETHAEHDTEIPAGEANRDISGAVYDNPEDDHGGGGEAERRGPCIGMGKQREGKRAKVW